MGKSVVRLPGVARVKHAPAGAASPFCQTAIGTRAQRRRIRIQASLRRGFVEDESRIRRAARHNGGHEALDLRAASAGCVASASAAIRDAVAVSGGKRRGKRRNGHRSGIDSRGRSRWSGVAPGARKHGQEAGNEEREPIRPSHCSSGSPIARPASTRPLPYSSPSRTIPPPCSRSWERVEGHWGQVLTREEWPIFRSPNSGQP